MTHLWRLANAGLTHVHLLPAFDFAKVPELTSDQKVPEILVPISAPDSAQPQAAIATVKDQDGFNWGYDPYHYGTPEGSYSTNPAGPTRIREFREMVKSFHLIGLRVVMDVVYNPTIYLYGEGWDFGEVANNALGENATQANMAGTGIATFSDRGRDAIRGGGAFDRG
jgi:pullulanase/glycogen debranching enzyme